MQLSHLRVGSVSSNCKLNRVAFWDAKLVGSGVGSVTLLVADGLVTGKLEAEFVWHQFTCS